MRHFGEQEKNWIHTINSFSGTGEWVSNLLDPILKTCRLKVSASQGTVEILLDTPQGNSEAQQVIDTVFSIQREVIRLISLVDYLVEQRLLILYKPTEPDDEYLLGQGGGSMPYHLHDEHIARQLCRYMSYNLVPTESLVALEKRGYISEEEHRFLRERRLTWLALGVSIILALLGIWFSPNLAAPREETRHVTEEPGQRLPSGQATGEEGLPSTPALDAAPAGNSRSCGQADGQQLRSTPRRAGGVATDPNEKLEADRRTSDGE